MDAFGGVDLCAATYTRHVFARHMHEGFAIAVVEAGAGEFNARGARHVAPAGAITVLHPEEAHTGAAARSGAPDGGACLTYRTFHLSRDAALRLAGVGELDGRWGTPTFAAPVLDDAPLARRLLALHDLLRASPAPLAQACALEQTLGDLFRRHAVLGPRAGRWVEDSPPRSGRTRADGTAAVIHRAREYLDGRYHDAVTLAELVRVTGVSESRLLRLFRRNVGLPPYAYVLTRRVEAAKRRLDAGDPAAQVALACGFADQSHLTRHFTRIVGLSPVQYARRPRIGVTVIEKRGSSRRPLP